MWGGRRPHEGRDTLPLRKWQPQKIAPWVSPKHNFPAPGSVFLVLSSGVEIQEIAELVPDRVGLVTSSHPWAWGRAQAGLRYMSLSECGLPQEMNESPRDGVLPGHTGSLRGRARIWKECRPVHNPFLKENGGSLIKCESAAETEQ